MRIGFITNSLASVGIKNLKDIADWAVENGFEDLEVGPTIPLDEAQFEEVLKEGKISITTLIYCRNFLSANEEEAREHQSQLKKRIEFASRLGIEKVVCSTGVGQASFHEWRFDPEKSLDKVATLQKDFAEMAEKKGVRLAYENCPLMGNIAISPYMWDILFDRIGSDKVGLVFDPSHLVWQFIDPYENIFRFKDRIFHVHAKDTQVMYNKLKEYGVLHASKWWRHRLPGLGDLDWNKIIANLYEIGYQGTISMEHEDPVWEGTEEKVKIGLVKSKEHIRQFMME